MARRGFWNNIRTFSYVDSCRANYPARKATSDLDVEIDKGADDSGYLAILQTRFHGFLTCLARPGSGPL